MKLLVTGGAGFIGSNFILYWLKKYPQDKIVNLDKLTYAGNLENLRSIEKNPNYEFVQGDICNPQLVNSLVRRSLGEGGLTGNVDVIVHFAAESHVDRSILDPAPFIKTNIEGTYVLLEAALKNKIKHFHHVSCYDEKTRAFTRNGLKNYWELSEKDEVLSLDLKTKEIEWKKISKVIIQDYEGKMIRIKSDRIDFFVTPNHRMLLQTKRGNLIFKEAQKLGSRNFLPKGVWKGKKTINRDLMYLLGFFIGDGCLAYQEKETLSLTGLTKQQYLTLSRDKENGQFTQIGLVGSIKKVISKSWRIFLDIPEKDSSRKRVENTLTNLGIDWHSHKGKAGEHLYFTSKNFFKIFEECGHGAKEKHIPRWALEEDKENLKALFEGLIDSDGRKTHNSTVFTTSSNKLVINFTELCIKLGLTPHIFKKTSKGNFYEGRLIKGGVSYHITVATTERSIIPKYGLNHIENISYKGKIWCVKIPKNKNLLVERNGIFALCGNTDEVFGALELNSKEKFNDTTPYNPHSPYSASKASSDHLVRAYHTTYNLPITISNCSNNFGPYQFPEKLIPLAITNIIEGKKVPVYGDGLYVRDWLYVKDHCRAIDVILQKGKIGETYFIGGSNEDINNLEVIKKILKLMNKDESIIEHVKDRPGHDRRYTIDWGKINRELGWKPEHNFDEYLKLTVDWYLKNQDWWKRIKYA